MLESQFDANGEDLDYKVCRVSQQQSVYMDESVEVGMWCGAVSPSLPDSAVPDQTFLTQDNFQGVQREVRAYMHSWYWRACCPFSCFTSHVLLSCRFQWQ